MALIDKLTTLANAIRAKNGTSDEMTLDQMIAAIESLTTGGSTGDSDLETDFILDESELGSAEL